MASRRAMRPLARATTFRDHGFLRRREPHLLTGRQPRRHESGGPGRPSSGYGVGGAARMTGQEVADARRYCLELLRTQDAPSYTLLAFIPAAAQTAYLAIRAFNVEVARVADTASTGHVGRMRMAFWRDAVGRALAGRPPAQPVAILLAHAAEAVEAPGDSSRGRGESGRSTGSRLSAGWFERVIAARERQLDGDGGGGPWPTLDALERYAEHTYSTLLYLTLQAVLPTPSLAADHVVSHIGKACGIAAVLRGVPALAFPGPPRNHHANSAGLAGDVAAERKRSAQGVVTLPLDVMAEAGLREEDVLRHGGGADGVRDAVFAVATRASDHLITARAMLRNLREGQGVGHDFEHEGETGHDHHHRQSPAEDNSSAARDVDRAFGVLMPGLAAQLWLDRLQAADFDLFGGGGSGGGGGRALRDARDWRLPWKAWLAFRRRQI